MTREDAARAAQALVLIPEGATFINYLVGKFGYARKTTAVAGEPHTTYFNEGQRSVLVDIGILLDLPLTTENNDGRYDSSHPGSSDPYHDTGFTSWDDIAAEYPDTFGGVLGR